MAGKQLEQYSWFPHIAWTLSLALALFVGYLALELRTTAQDLQDSSLSLEQRLEDTETMLNQDSATSSHDQTETRIGD